MNFLPHILVIENNKVMCDTLRESLRSEYQVICVSSGRTGIYYTDRYQYDAIILDVSLDDIPGAEVCQLLRERGVKTPIIVASGTSTIKTKIELLDSGANDYITKPFSLGELKARLRAQIRDTPIRNRPMQRLHYSEIEINLSTREVWRDGTLIDLRRKEFALLERLMMQPEVVVSRNMLIEHAWEVYSHHAKWANNIDVHMKYLRDKLDKPFDTAMIRTVHGIGYRLVAAKPSSEPAGAVQIARR